MQLVRQRPIAFGRIFGPDFDRLFDSWDDRAEPRAWVPAVDLVESGDSLVARFEVPGFDAENLTVTLENGVLALSGERAFESEEQDATYHRRELARGAFRRSIRVGDHYDTNEVEATYKDGILEVTLAKRPEVLPRKIEISTAG